MPSDPSDLYPVTIVTTRYGGAYEGGTWAALRCPPDLVPRAVHDGGETECEEFFEDPQIPVGVGNTPQEALDRLAAAVLDRGPRDWYPPDDWRWWPDTPHYQARTVIGTVESREDKPPVDLKTLLESAAAAKEMIEAGKRIRPGGGTRPAGYIVDEIAPMLDKG